MTGRRPLRFILFFFEVPRLAFVLVAVSALGGASGSSSAAAFAAPQALFILLSLFSWYDSERYDAYRPIFSVGKFISAVSLAMWLIGAFNGILSKASLSDVRSVIALGAAAAVAVYDFLTGVLVGVSVLRTRVAVEADGNLPNLVVDEVADVVGDNVGDKVGGS